MKAAAPPPFFLSERFIGLPLKIPYNKITSNNNSTFKSLDSTALESLSSDAFTACCELWALVFAKDGRTAATVEAERREDMKSKADEMWHIIWEVRSSGSSRRIVSAARTFRRIIRVGGDTNVSLARVL
jgi:hypothetical protein